MTSRDDEAAIIRLLAEHVMVPNPVDWVLCSVAGDCNWEEWKGDETPEELHRAHVAAVLAAHMADREADAWDAGFNVGAHYASADLSHATYSAPPPPNPYRETSE